MIRLFIIYAIVLLLSVACCAAPYRGAPTPVPGLVEAEDYDTGGEGVAYHDVVRCLSSAL